jgi:hypothetical protein
VIDGIIILDLVILLVLIALSAMFNGAEAATSRWAALGSSA